MFNVLCLFALYTNVLAVLTCVVFIFYRGKSPNPLSAIPLSLGTQTVLPVSTLTSTPAKVNHNLIFPRLYCHKLEKGPFMEIIIEKKHKKRETNFA